MDAELGMLSNNVAIESKCTASPRQAHLELTDGSTMTAESGSINRARGQDGLGRNDETK